MNTLEILPVRRVFLVHFPDDLVRVPALALHHHGPFVWSFSEEVPRGIDPDRVTGLVVLSGLDLTFFSTEARCRHCHLEVYTHGK